MQKLSLDAMARQLAKRASQEPSGRAAETIFGGHHRALRQTVVALRAGSELAEHDSPGDATVLVIEGRLRIQAGEESWEGRSTDLLPVPAARHSVVALTDVVFLLSVGRVLN